MATQCQAWWIIECFLIRIDARITLAIGLILVLIFLLYFIFTYQETETFK